MNHKNAMVNVKALSEVKENLSKNYQQLQTETSTLRAKNENLDREIHSKNELIHQMEE